MFSTKSEVLLGFVTKDVDKVVALINVFKERQLAYTPFDFTQQCAALSLLLASGSIISPPLTCLLTIALRG